MAKSLYSHFKNDLITCDLFSYKLIMSLNQLEPSTKLQFILHETNSCAPIVPKKAYFSDVGYDLTLIKQVKEINSNTTMYDSGISVIPPIGHYIEIVPRSSLSTSGHIMANSIGIIDPTYRGTLKVVLTKVIDSAEDMRLPFTRFQLILRKIIDVDVDVHNINDTNSMQNFSNSTLRGTGGFGSTD